MKEERVTMKVTMMSFSLLFIILLMLATCSNPMSDGSGGNSTIIIDLGSGDVPGIGAKGVSISDLTHFLTFSGPTGVLTRAITGGGTVKVTVVAGTWQIDVEAFLGNVLYAVGSATAQVKAGLNTNVSIQMNVVWTNSSIPIGGGGGGSTGTKGLTADPVAFTDPSGTITVTYSSGGTYTNAITTAHSGSGVISYTSSDTSVATVDASGVVTLLKGGTTTIKAEKAADATYDGSWVSYTLEVNKITSNVIWPVISSVTYAPGLTLGGFSFSPTNAGTTLGTFSWALPATTTLGDAGSKSYTMNFTVDPSIEDFYADAYLSISFTVDKDVGAGVSVLSGAATYNSITLNAVTVSTSPTNTGQVAEYAVSLTSSLPTSGWQTASGPTIPYGSLTPSTPYYVFARSRETTNYEAGTPSSTTITTDATTVTFSLSPTSVTFTTTAYPAVLPGAQTITVTNNGTGSGTASISLSSGASFDLSTGSLTLGAGASNTFTVVPKSTLVPSATAYTDTINVTGGTTSPTVSVSFTYNKGTGASILSGVPTVSGTPTTTGITVSGGSIVLNPATGQSLEYAISTSDSAVMSTLTWQSTMPFTGLKSSTNYYVYARAADNANYYAGTTMSAASAAIKTGDVSFTITFAQIADEAQSLITGPTISRTGSPKTALLSVASPGDYAYINWFITGTSITGTGPTFTLDSADDAYNGVGAHFLTLEVEKGGKPYSKQISFTVTN